MRLSILIILLLNILFLGLTLHPQFASAASAAAPTVPTMKEFKSECREWKCSLPSEVEWIRVQMFPWNVYLLPQIVCVLISWTPIRRSGELSPSIVRFWHGVRIDSRRSPRRPIIRCPTPPPPPRPAAAAITTSLWTRTILRHPRSQRHHPACWSSS